MCGQGKTVDGFEALNVSQRFSGKWCFALERVERDAFEEIAERKIEVLGEAFQDFDQVLLHPGADLHPLDGFLFMRSRCLRCYIVTDITMLL